MTVYDSMTPFTDVAESELEVSAKPLLQIRTADPIPIKARNPSLDWNHWDGPGWHNQPWPRSDIKNGRDIKLGSPQSLPSLDHASPTSEDLSHLPECHKCGLTTKQHEMVRAYICGHLCPDFLQDKLCPDIDAPQLGRKDCPIHNPKGGSITRRRSSLSQPPMLARDESTYKDLNEEKESQETVQSLDQGHPVKEHEPTFQNAQSASEKPMYHVCLNASGDADWKKHCRVEKAMKQMLFGDARVSAPLVLEQTQRLVTSEQNLVREIGQDSIATAEDCDDLRTAMAAAELEAEQHTVERGDQYTAAGNKKLGKLNFKATNLQSEDHLGDCAICSEDEEEAEDVFQATVGAAKPETSPRGCASDDDCSTCAGDPDSHVDFWDFAPEEPPRHFKDASRAC